MRFLSRQKTRWIALLFLIPLRVFAGTPPDADCIAFGEQLAQLINDGKGSEVVKYFDQFGFADRVIRGLDFTEKDAADYRSGLMQSLGPALRQNFALFNGARFLRLQKVDGETRALVRATNKEGAMNYFGFICVTRTSATVFWSDAYVYLTGETMAAGARRSTLPLVAQSKKSLLAKLTGAESDYVKHFPMIGRAMTEIREGKTAEAWSHLNELPASLQTDRTVLTGQLRLAQARGNDAYLAIIQKWENAYPGDPALALVSIDGDILREDYPAFFRHVEDLQRQTGGDPYLDWLAANIHLSRAQFKEACERAEQALKADPNDVRPYDVLLTALLKQSNFAQAVTVLDRLVAQFPGGTFDGSFGEGEALYQDFRKSAEFAAWVRQRNTKPALTP